MAKEFKVTYFKKRAQYGTITHVTDFSACCDEMAISVNKDFNIYVSIDGVNLHELHVNKNIIRYCMYCGAKVAIEEKTA